MSDQFAIVTGTSSGIGAAVARKLLSNGWGVLGVARRAATFEGAYEHAAIDLSDPAAVQAHFTGPFSEAHDLRRFERVALVNNAGRLGPVASLPSTRAEDLAAALTLNAAVPAWLMGFVISHSTGTVRIVNISSGAAGNPYPGWGAYCMGKAALRMAGRVAASESEEVPAQQGRSIAVVDYAPGVADTPMQDEVRTAERDEFPRLQKFLDLKSQGKLVDPSEPAAEISGLLTRDDLPPYSELRFG